MRMHIAYLIKLNRVLDWTNVWKLPHAARTAPVVSGEFCPAGRIDPGQNVVSAVTKVQAGFMDLACERRGEEWPPCRAGGRGYQADDS